MGRSPCSDESGLKKGSWTPDEDQKLVQFIAKNGNSSWRALPKLAGLNRCGKSCRLRWTNYLRPDIKRGKFSQQEEQTIIHLQSFLGNKWSAIATHLPGRTDNEIKNFWNTNLKKKLIQIGFDPMTHRPRSDLFSSLPQLIALANLNELWNQKPQLEAQVVLRLQSEAAQLASLQYQYVQYLFNSAASTNSNPLLTDRTTGIEAGFSILNTVSSSMNENPTSEINNPSNYSHLPDLQAVPNSLQSSPNSETGHGSNITMFNVQEGKTPTSLWVPPQKAGTATTTAKQNENFSFSNPSDESSATSSEGREVPNYLWPEFYLEDPFTHEIA